MPLIPLGPWPGTAVNPRTLPQQRTPVLINSVSSGVFAILGKLTEDTPFAIDLLVAPCLQDLTDEKDFFSRNIFFV